MANNPKEELTKFQASVEDDNFAVGLINEVLKAFLSATEPRIQVNYIDPHSAGRIILCRVKMSSVAECINLRSER